MRRPRARRRSGKSWLREARPLHNQPAGRIEMSWRARHQLATCAAVAASLAVGCNRKALQPPDATGTGGRSHSTAARTASFRTPTWPWICRSSAGVRRAAGPSGGRAAVPRRAIVRGHVAAAARRRLRHVPVGARLHDGGQRRPAHRNRRRARRGHPSPAGAARRRRAPHRRSAPVRVTRRLPGIVVDVQRPHVRDRRGRGPHGHGPGSGGGRHRRRRLQRRDDDVVDRRGGRRTPEAEPVRRPRRSVRVVHGGGVGALRPDATVVLRAERGD